MKVEGKWKVRSIMNFYEDITKNLSVFFFLFFILLSRYSQRLSHSKSMYPVMKNRIRVYVST